MKAIAIEKYGDVDVLQEVKLPIPKLTDPFDMLIQVHAVATNPADPKVRCGLGDTNAPLPFKPWILGWDASGVVVEVGSNATNFKVGDEVYYSGHMYRQGCNAQYQLMDSRLVSRKPRSLSFEQAAAIPLTGLTMWELLHDR